MSILIKIRKMSLCSKKKKTKYNKIKGRTTKRTITIIITIIITMIIFKRNHKNN